ncbi:MAG TPA: hypothetical protein VK025_14955 [Steroidobacter sp.]|jgi:heme/copper-type cytochrome/quinol oxidase subunit 2|nr:hypothetical protein [Steroidobacteraceae bacterium]HLS82697.1 hypothetical protein [Steroidobacter sp.]
MLAIFWVCATLTAAIFTVMIWSFATFRRRTLDAGACAYRRSTVIEVLWALIPIAIVTSAAAPAARMIAPRQPAQLLAPVNPAPSPSYALPHVAEESVKRVHDARDGDTTPRRNVARGKT